MTHRKHLDKYSNEKERPDLEPEKPANAKPRASYILSAVGSVSQKKKKEERSSLLKVSFN